MRILALSFLFVSSSLLAQDKPAAPVAVASAPQAPDVPSQKLGKDGEVNPQFLKSHESFVTVAKQGKAKLVFLGDSITAGWNRNKEIWDQAFGQYEPANFGIGGDRTQHVLWRITNGELDGIQPKAVVIMIGTNNSGNDSAEGIAKGITKIVTTVREKQPQAKILLLAVFPRGEKPENNPGRAKLTQVNQMISKLDDGQNVFYLDIGSKFTQPDGSLTKEIMPDFLHLSPAGYQIWADAIKDKLAVLMK